MDKLHSEVETVVCDVCHKEVPKTEAVMPEVVDYVAHFCGLACYDQWRRQGGQDMDVKKPA